MSKGTLPKKNMKRFKENNNIFLEKLWELKKQPKYNNITHEKNAEISMQLVSCNITRQQNHCILNKEK